MPLTLDVITLLCTETGTLVFAGAEDADMCSKSWESFGVLWGGGDGARAGTVRMRSCQSKWSVICWWCYSEHYRTISFCLDYYKVPIG